MTSPTIPEDAPHQPRSLDRLLAALRRRLLGKVWLHGIGTCLAAVALWLVFAYLADWGLRVPMAIRIVHGVGLIAIVVVLVWRDLLRPFSRLPDTTGLAILLERRHPELKELLISAVQLRDSRSDGDSPELVERILAEAEERSQSLRARGVLDDGPPRRRFLLGAISAAIVAVLALSHPTHAAILFERMFGGSRAWPQRTHLTIEIPGLSTQARTREDGEHILVRVARGTDVPILVHAEGVVPNEVTLHFEGGRDLVLPRSGGGRFRTLLRSLQEDVIFHATGGDDDDELPLVEAVVLQPPDVEGIAIHVEPPAYCGLDPSLTFDRDVEVLRGSRIRVHVLPFPANADGVARLLPEDRTVPLEEIEFPAREPTPESATAPAAGERERTRRGLGFELTPEETVGLRIELVDATGLANPDPGLFRIRVVDDRAPEVRVLAPSRTDFEIVQGGAVPLRARAEDDFGLVSMHWEVRPSMSGGEGEPTSSGDLRLRDVEASGDADSETTAPPLAALGSTRLEVNELGTAEVPVSVGLRFDLQFVAVDNRSPESGRTRSHPVRARVVTPDELLRRMQDRLGQARLSAIRLSDLQREKRRRIEELLDSVEGDGSLESGESLALAAALSGQRRVWGDAQSLARDLALLAEDILYARLDDKAGAMLDFYDARQSEISDLRFHVEPMRELARAVRDAQLGANGFAANLVQLVDLALEISEEHTAEAAEALARAERSLGAADTQEALLEAASLQTLALDRMEDLLAELAEWDNFQNVLALTRDILNRQKALRQRTQQFASQK